MHLSLLSDCYLSDSMNDGGRSCYQRREHNLARSHQDGIKRGFFVMLMLALPLGLTFAADEMHKPAISNSAVVGR
jgi:hypothetical protein